MCILLDSARLLSFLETLGILDAVFPLSPLDVIYNALGDRLGKLSSLR